MKNPALTQEARYEPASVIPLKRDTSLLDWLQDTGRLLPRDQVEGEQMMEEEEEIDALIETEESDYEDEDLEE